MAKSKVYFTNMRTTYEENLPEKLERLIKTAGIGTIDFKDKFTAVKIHFGEPGNLAFLRPNYAAVVVNVIKSLGGMPYLTDCNTLYSGGRKNALEHIDAAYKNGFYPYATGAQVIIADGIKGTDDVRLPVIGGEYIKEAIIGRGIADADIIISLNHFKGHEGTGIGGALKNLGMGCGSKAGKAEMHSAGKPEVDGSLCVGCGRCAEICAHGAAVIEDGVASIRHDVCKGCGRCIKGCPNGAIHKTDDKAEDILCAKISEYAKAVVEGKPNFHINIVVDISPFCDCHSENDVPITPDVGMFASFDPVALDLACADAVNSQPVIAGSRLDEAEKTHGDHFTDSMPWTNWRVGIDHGKKIGLGNNEYELITI